MSSQRHENLSFLFWIEIFYDYGRVKCENLTFSSYQRLSFHSRACQNCTSGNINHCKHSKCVMADGVKRGFLSINFDLPAPAIHVCKNDVIVVDLANDAPGTATRFSYFYSNILILIKSLYLKHSLAWHEANWRHTTFRWNALSHTSNAAYLKFTV